ncbi:MAG: hypothetical protein Q4F84_00635, partial [Fibrobacter sp.]|nr:hypothetical protein [Fibrobacter sp.]
MMRLLGKQFACVFLFVCLVSTSVLCAETGFTGIGFTKDTAIKNAIKHGVEKKIRKYVSDHVYRQNEQLITREFIDSAFLYVSDTNVVLLDTQFNCFRVEMRINIDNIKLKEKLEAHGLEVKKVVKPAIILLVDEYQDGNIMPEKTASIVLKQILVKNGYTVGLGEINNHIGDTVHLSNIADFGFENSADLVIKGTVNTGKATDVDVYGKTQKTVPVQMNIEAIRTDNAQIVFSATINLRKNSANEFSALQFALKSAAQAMGKKIVDKLDVFCENDDYAVRHFEFVINGVNYTKASEFETNIKKISCVKSAKLCYLEGQRASYAISING